MFESRGSYGVAVRYGRAVDGYLAREGAHAQAIGGHTILLGSGVLALSPVQRALIIAHELAHLEQLGRPGRDGVRVLEDEAWEAAHAWLCGQSFRIKGRARGRLNAEVLINSQPKSGKNHPSAPDWYNLGIPEPIGNNASLKPGNIQLLADMTIETLLDKLASLNGVKEVIVVAHGMAGGLSIPVLKGSSRTGDYITLGNLAADHDRVEQGAVTVRHPKLSDDDLNRKRTLGTLEEIGTIRRKMNLVRAKKFKHIAFRACEFGSGTETMKALRLFFGAESISAPKLFDSYGTFESGVSRESMKQWAERYGKPDKKGRKYRVAIDGAIGFATRSIDAFNYAIEFKAETAQAGLAWVRKHINDKYNGGDVVYHAMIVNPYSDRPPTIYFHRDPEFAGNIVYYAG